MFVNSPNDHVSCSNAPDHTLSFEKQNRISPQMKRNDCAM